MTAVAAFALGFAKPVAAFVIRSGGGDCSKIGVWNQKTRTCTLNRDLVNEHTTSVPKTIINIEEDGIVIDGAGHKLSGLPGEGGTGVALKWTNNCVVKNIAFENFENAGVLVYGIDLNEWIIMGSVGNRIVANSFAGCVYAIDAIYTDNLAISNNTFTGNPSAIDAYYGDGLLISGNTFSGSSFYSTTVLNHANATISGNLSMNNFVGYVIGSDVPVGYFNFTGNTVHDMVHINAGASVTLCHNNFHAPVYASECGWPSGFNVWDPLGLASFSKPLPVGGNYWSNYDTPAEGCEDADINGICDLPYQQWIDGVTFGGPGTQIPFCVEKRYQPGVDDLPWARPNGWVSGINEICSDRLDNDGDGRTDCADPDCAKNRACRKRGVRLSGRLR